MESIKRNELLWMDVPKKCIVQFLRNFTTHQWHMAFHSNELADFIENSNHLETWDVVIPGGTGDREDIGKWSINKEKRKICSANDDAILISGHKVRVGSLGCTKSALSDEEIRKAEEKFRNQNPDKAKSAVPDNAYLIANRKPLLILHIIQPIESKNEPGLLFKIGTNKLIALGVGFPKFNDEDESKKARYKLNLVEIRNWFMSEEEDDYDVND